MPQLDASDIEQIATLARLDLTEEEKVRYAKELSLVFGYMGLLNEVDTQSVEETCQVTGLTNITREDVSHECRHDTRDQLLALFPERVGNLLKVPGVFE